MKYIYQNKEGTIGHRVSGPRRQIESGGSFGEETRQDFKRGKTKSLGGGREVERQSSRNLALTTGARGPGGVQVLFRGSF